jgi:hypothetical protein
VHDSDVAPAGQSCAALMRVVNAYLAEPAQACRLVEQQALGQADPEAQWAERCNASTAELRFLERAETVPARPRRPPAP